MPAAPPSNVILCAISATSQNGDSPLTTSFAEEINGTSYGFSYFSQFFFIVLGNYGTILNNLNVSILDNSGSNSVNLVFYNEINKGRITADLLAGYTGIVVSPLQISMAFNFSGSLIATFSYIQNATIGTSSDITDVPSYGYSFTLVGSDTYANAVDVTGSTMMYTVVYSNQTFSAVLGLSLGMTSYFTPTSIGTIFTASAAGIKTKQTVKYKGNLIQKTVPQNNLICVTCPNPRILYTVPATTTTSTTVGFAFPIFSVLNGTESFFVTDLSFLSTKFFNDTQTPLYNYQYRTDPKYVTTNSVVPVYKTLAEINVLCEACHTTNYANVVSETLDVKNSPHLSTLSVAKQFTEQTFFGMVHNATTNVQFVTGSQSSEATKVKDQTSIDNTNLSGGCYLNIPSGTSFTASFTPFPSSMGVCGIFPNLNTVNNFEVTLVANPSAFYVIGNEQQTIVVTATLPSYSDVNLFTFNWSSTNSTYVSTSSENVIEVTSIAPTIVNKAYVYPTFATITCTVKNKYFFTGGASTIGVPYDQVSPSPTTTIPTGCIVAWPSTAAPPSGWLLCNGQKYSTSTYPDLYVLIGSTYGELTPNFTDCFPTGWGGTSTSQTVGTTGGISNVTLNTSNMPPHQHTVSATINTDPHTHNTANGRFTKAGGGPTVATNAGGTPIESVTLSLGITLEDNGSGEAIPILNPYVSMYYIIFTGSTTSESSVMPVGATFLFGSEVFYPDWLSCNGTTFSSQEYSELYTFFGSSDILPNLIGSAIFGTSQNIPCLTSGGSTAVTLTLNTLPSHTHNVSCSLKNPTHNHGIGASVGVGPAKSPEDGSVMGAGGGAGGGETSPTDPGVTITVSDAGSSSPTPFSIQNPFTALYYIIIGVVDNNPVPVGTIVWWPITEIPNGWLPCTGQQYPTNTFSSLYIVIGNTFGGNEEYFNVPQMTNNMAIGVGQTSGPSLGQRGGSTMSPSLNINNLPSHSHSFTNTSLSHSHSFVTVTTQGNNEGAFANQSGSGSGIIAANNPLIGPISCTCDSTGGGEAFSIQNPYITMAFIIKW